MKKVAEHRRKRWKLIFPTMKCLHQTTHLKGLWVMAVLLTQKVIKSARHQSESDKQCSTGERAGSANETDRKHTQGGEGYHRKR